MTATTKGNKKASKQALNERSHHAHGKTRIFVQTTRCIVVIESGILHRLPSEDGNGLQKQTAVQTTTITQKCTRTITIMIMI
mmetsp:Transcript_10883/g.25366  ORF Transcript_10883/g.25366 Transcript_10883/m.25366 type:complete len:82 (-) Transcript_10883:44-289(-)